MILKKLQIAFPMLSLFILFWLAFGQGILACSSWMYIICTLSEVSCPTPHFCWTSSAMFRLQVADVSKITLFQDTCAYVHHVYCCVPQEFHGNERRPLVSAEPELLGWLICEVTLDPVPTSCLMHPVFGWFRNTGPSTNRSAWSNLAFDILCI